MCADFRDSQERVVDPLELELQIVVSCLIQKLGTKLGSSVEESLTTGTSLQHPGNLEELSDDRKSLDMF